VNDERVGNEAASATRAIPCEDGRLALVVSRVKLVWFVPSSDLDATRDAVFAAGGGRIGDYERCSWYTAGTGTYFGGEDTAPAIGTKGREEHVSELRVETVVPDDRLETVVAALRAAHPYEEPAFDIYPLLGT